MEGITATFAVDSDVSAVTDFLCSDFVYRESLNAALHKKPAEVRPVIEYFTKECIQSGTSCVLRNEKGAIVGVRMSTFQYREKEENDDGENVETSENPGAILGLLEKLGNGKWSRIPAGCDKLLYVVIISVASEYGRRGLGRFLLEWGMERIQAEEGVNGIVAEATGCNSQALFAKLGYDVINEVAHSEYFDDSGNRIFNCTDGTYCAQLVFRRL